MRIKSRIFIVRGSGQIADFILDIKQEFDKGRGTGQHPAPPLALRQNLPTEVLDNLLKKHRIVQNPDWPARKFEILLSQSQNVAYGGDITVSDETLSVDRLLMVKFPTLLTVLQSIY